MRLADIFALLRVKQWIKNIFVLAAFLFTRSWTDPSKVTHVLMAMVAMCLICSSVYIANDLLDRKADANHPSKKNRPIASGAVSAQFAIIMMAVTGFVGFVAAFSTGQAVVFGALAYIALQIVYNAVLKHHAVIDVFCIAAGFVVRVIIGAVAIQVSVSSWLLVCAASLALLLGFGKRRHEFHLAIEGENTRRSLTEYSAQSLDFFVLFAATCAGLTYGVYSIESNTAQEHVGLVLTTPFVWYGICRYLLLVFKGGETGEPETLVLRDLHLVLSFIGFVFVAMLVMSGMNFSFLER